jgi:hypothetical protein
VALAATPATGYRFRAWSGACTGTGSCSLTMTTSRTVGATFVSLPGHEDDPRGYEAPLLDERRPRGSP